MGGGVFKSIGKAFKSVAKVVTKVAKVAVPIALAYYTGGTSAALMSAGSSALSGAFTKTPKVSNAVTGAVGGNVADSPSQPDPAQAAAAAENQRRLALNAAGNSQEEDLLGVTSKAKVSRRKLLGN